MLCKRVRVEGHWRSVEPTLSDERPRRSVATRLVLKIAVIIFKSAKMIIKVAKCTGDLIR